MDHAPAYTFLGDCGVHSLAPIKSNECLIEFFFGIRFVLLDGSSMGAFSDHDWSNYVQLSNWTYIYIWNFYVKINFKIQTCLFI